MGVKVDTNAGPFEFDKHVLLELTKRCNYFCVHCYADASPWAKGPEPRPVDVHNLRQSLSRLGFPLLTLSGGEVMLRKDIDALVGAGPYDVRQWLFTSGIGMDSGRLMKWQTAVEGYSVSLDGGSTLHNRVRRSPRSYDDIISFLRLLRRHGATVQLQSMVLRGHLEYIPILVELAQELGILGILFSHVSPDGRGRELSSDRMSPAELEELQGRIDELKPKTTVKLFTNLMPRQILKSRFPLPVLHILPDGLLLPWFGVRREHALGSLADCGWDLVSVLATGEWIGAVNEVFARARERAQLYPATAVPVDDILVETFRETSPCA